MIKEETPEVVSLGECSEVVYDVETSEHTFLGNGILLHNSCYINLWDVIEKFDVKNKTWLEKTNFLDQVCKRITEKAIDPMNRKMAEQMNLEPSVRDIIKFDREVIAIGEEPDENVGFWLGKKHYLLRVSNNEGLQYDSPHTKVIGLEFKKISLPEFVRKALEKICVILVKSGIEEVRKEVKKFKKEYFSKTPHEIGSPIGVSEIEEYTDPKTNLYWTGIWYDSKLGKERNGGVPAQSKAAIRYNYLVKKLGLEKKYPLFTNGAKIYMVYLKENPYGFDTIGFHDDIPEEFGLAEYVDYEKMWVKQCYHFLEDTCDRCGLSLEKRKTLDEFF